MWKITNGKGIVLMLNTIILPQPVFSNTKFGEAGEGKVVNEKLEGS
jgi:hypothetical protein